MSKRTIYAESEKLPATLQTAILARFLNEKEIKSLWESYKNSRYRHMQMGPPTPLQYKISKLRQEGKKIREIANILKVKDVAVYSAMKRVAMYEYFRVK